MDERESRIYESAPKEEPPGMPDWVKAAFVVALLGLLGILILHWTGVASSGH